jgi:hypothetical protein
MSELRLKMPQAGEPVNADNFDPGGAVGDVLTKLAPPSPGLPPDYAWRPGGGIPAPAVSQNVYVALAYGSDVTGTGTQTKPYATVAFALGTILDNTVAKPYEIFVDEGQYVGAIALKPFVSIIGVDPSLVDLAGNFTLDASFADHFTGQIALVKGCNVDGLLTIDYVAAGSSAGSVNFRECLISGDVALTQSSTNATAFDECLLFGNYTQTGGFAQWHNTSGTVGINLLSMIGPGVLDAFGGGWAGSVTVDQNAVVGNCGIRSRGFSMSQGSVNVITTIATVPFINADEGDLPENCNLSGANAVMSPQMRVSHQFPNIAPNPTAIGAAGTTTISLPFPSAAFFGATPIESCHMSAALVGANWGTFIGPQAVSVTITFRTNAGVPTVDVNFYTPGAGFNITDAIDLNVTGYLPLVL